MEINEVLENLCYYDIRNPNNDLDILSQEDGIVNGECYCDNCFYGRHKLANYILELLKYEHR